MQSLVYSSTMKITLVLFSLCWICAKDSFAQNPTLINFQAQVQAVGGPIASIDFKLFPNETGDQQLLWEERQEVNIQTDGTFNVLLGSVNPFGDGLFVSGERLFLELQIGSQVLAPRYPITTVPFARHATTAGSALDMPIVKFLEAETNTDSYFSVLHGIEDHERIIGMNVAILRSNDRSWHTMDNTNTFRNRFWWNDRDVNGQILGDLRTEFAARQVKIILFLKRD